VVAVESACATESAPEASVALLLYEPITKAIAAIPVQNILFFMFICYNQCMAKFSFVNTSCEKNW